MLNIQLKWETQRLQGTLPQKIVNACNFHEDHLYLVVDNLKQNDLYSLSLIDFKWRKVMSPFPFKPRFKGCFIINQGKLYCYGGSVDAEGSILLDSMLELDLQTLNERWIKNSPQGRIEHAMCAYRGQIFIYGGRTQKKIFNDCRTYQVSLDKWTMVDNDPSFRFGHQATVYEDTIVITGGSDGSSILEDVWLLVDMKTWIKLDIKNPCELFRHQATLALQEYIIVFGGCSLDGQRYNDNFMALNIELQKWIELPRISRHPYPRIQHSLLSLTHENRQDILLLGGLNFNDLSILNFTLLALLADLQPQQSVMTYRSHTIEKEEFFNDIPMEVQVSCDEGTSFLELGTYYEWKKEHPQGDQFSPRTGHSVVQCLDQLILFCGSDEYTIVNDMYAYHIHKKIWEYIPARGYFPCPRSGCKGVSYANMIFYFGGYTKPKGDYFNDLYKFDRKQNYWTQIRANKDISPRVDMTLVLNSGKLYIFGGADSSTRYNDLHCFDILSNQWIKLQTHGQLPSPRFGHTAEVYRNQMYIFGGWDGFKTLDELYTYSFASNYWYLERVRSRPPSRYRHSSTLIGCSIFIFGGVDAKMTRYNDLYEFNCETREWKSIETAGITPSARTFHQLCAYDTTLYLIGGNDGIKKNNDMYSIQVFDNRFSDLSSMSQLELQSSINPIENGIIQILKQQVQELEIRLKYEQEFNLCQICNNQDINSVFLECGHRFCCYDCSNKLEICKICNKQPSRIIKIYVV